MHYAAFPTCWLPYIGREVLTYSTTRHNDIVSAETHMSLGLFMIVNTIVMEVLFVLAVNF